MRYHKNGKRVILEADMGTEDVGTEDVGTEDVGTEDILPTEDSCGTNA